MASNLVAQQLLIVVVIFHIQHVHWLFYWKTWQILAVTFIYSPCSRTFLQKPAAVLQTQHHPGLQQTFCSYTEGKCSVCTYCTVLLWLRSSNKAPSQGSFWTRFQLLTRAAQIPSVRVCFVKIACWTQNHIKEHLSSQFTQFGFMFTAVFMKKDVLWVTVTVCTHKEDTSAYFEKNGKKKIICPVLLENLTNLWLKVRTETSQLQVCVHSAWYLWHERKNRPKVLITYDIFFILSYHRCFSEANNQH